jgi:hypothetical protein
MSIDLVARLVVVDSTASSPGPEGIVWYHEGRCCTKTRLRYHLADDWHFASEIAWQTKPTSRSTGRLFGSMTSSHPRTGPVRSKTPVPSRGTLTQIHT